MNYIRISDNCYQIKLSQDLIDLSGLISEFYTLKYLHECDCDTYSRKVNNFRQLHAKKIYCEVEKKQNVKILFYNCYLLLHELYIILSIHEYVDEIHLTDNIYSNIFNSDYVTNISGYIDVRELENINLENNTNARIILALFEFLSIIKKHNVNSKIYIHINPNKIIKDTFYYHYFDVISAIDFLDNNEYYVTHENVKNKNISFIHNIFGIVSTIDIIQQCEIYKFMMVLLKHNAVSVIGINSYEISDIRCIYIFRYNEINCGLSYEIENYILKNYYTNIATKLVISFFSIIYSCVHKLEYLLDYDKYYTHNELCVHGCNDELCVRDDNDPPNIFAENITCYRKYLFFEKFQKLQTTKNN